MDTHTKAVPLLDKVASLLDVSTAELQSWLIQEFNTICADPIEGPRYPSTQEAFLDFALKKINELDDVSMSTLRKIIHRDEVRKFYFFPNELEAISRILEVIERADYYDVFLNGLDLYTLPPLLLKTRRLRSLDVSDNHLKDLSLIADITGLEILQASNNQVTDLSCLIGASHLEGLSLAQNNIRETLEVLQTIPTLRVVDLSNNKINDTQAKKVLEISFIEKVYLTGNPINAPVEILNDIENLRAHFHIEFLEDAIARELKMQEQQQSNVETPTPQSTTAPAEPIYISSAIRDIRLRGNPDKVRV
jgi:Leucine-rich repeat (LRR) protein